MLRALAVTTGLAAALAPPAWAGIRIAPDAAVVGGDLQLRLTCDQAAGCEGDLLVRIDGHLVADEGYGFARAGRGPLRVGLTARPAARTAHTALVREYGAHAVTRVTLHRATVSERRAQCRPAGYAALGASRQVRVLQPVAGPLFPYGIGPFVGCRPSTGRWTGLSSFGDGLDGPVAVRGSLVALATRECPGETSSSCVPEIEVTDTASSPVRRAATDDDPGARRPSQLGSGVADVPALVLGPDGAVAWTGTDAAGRRTLHRLDARGTVLLVEDPALDLTSLRATGGGGFSWTAGGVAASDRWQGTPLTVGG